jgi:hypothetical protein
MKEFLLGPLLAGKKLDIVNQEDIRLAVVATKRRAPIVPQSIDEITGKTLGWHIHDTPRCLLLANVVADGLEQVSLSQSAAPIDEQRIVSLRREVRHGKCRGLGKLVRRANHKIGKCLVYPRARNTILRRLGSLLPIF